MLNILLAGIGGFFGTIMRYLVNLLIYRWIDYPTFPYGTLIVNLVGCLLIGFLSGLVETREIFSAELRIFIFIGILGGFTTFSSFGYDTFGLMRDGQFLYAALNVSLQVFLGLAAVWLGYNLGR